MSDLAISPSSFPVIEERNEKTIDNQKRKKFFTFLTKNKLKLTGAAALLLLSSYLYTADHNKPFVITSTNPNSTITQQINNQVIQTVVNESVVPNMQSTYMDLAAQEQTAYNEGRYCDYSKYKYQEAKIILDNPAATTTDLWRAYGIAQQAAAVNPFDNDLQLTILDAMVKLGLNTQSRNVYLKDALAIQSSCEQ